MSAKVCRPTTVMSQHFHGSPEAGASKPRVPKLRFKTIKLSRHSGMDRRNPDCRDANNPCHPWSLGSGDPCRNDEFLLNLMAVKLRLGMRYEKLCFPTKKPEP